jgi:PAS domain S-box-containing protein
MGFRVDAVQRFLKERVRFVTPKVPLRLVLTAPFVVQIISIVGLVGYLSYQSGQQAVENLANQLLNQTSARVSDRLNSYLELPQKIVETNHLAANQGTLDLNNNEQLRQQFWQQIQINPSLPTIGFFGEDGKGVNYFRITSKEFQFLAEKATGQSIPMGTVLFNKIIPNQRDYFTIDAQGKPLKLIFRFKDDFRTVKWYRQAKMNGKQTWTAVTLARVLPILQTLAVDPLSDKTGKFKGFFVASYVLSEISLFLNQIRLSPKGQVFILENQGDLVATSIASEASGKIFNSGKFSRLNAKNSQDLVTREATKLLIEQFGSLANFKESKQLRLNVAGQSEFVQVSPYQDKYGLNWLIVTVVPESDFMGQIYDNVRQTILWCGLALIATIGSAILLANWITRPIIRLSQISDRMAKGEWQDSSDSDQEESAIAEIQTLFASFNLMSAQVRQSLDQTSAALQEKAFWFNTLVEAIPDPIFLKDGEGKWLIVNPQGLKLFEMEGIDYFGKTDLELAELIPFYHDAFFYCAATDQIAWQQKVTRIEEQIPKADGSHRTFDVFRVPLFSENGDRLGLVVIGRDISDRKQIEIALLESETRRQLSLDLTDTGSWEFEVATGNAIWSGSHYRLMGLMPHELSANIQVWRDRVHPEDLEWVEAAFAHALETHSLLNIEYRIIYADGTLRWVLTKGQGIYKNGKAEKMLGVMLDISDRKSAELQLRQSETTNRAILNAIPDLLLRMGRDGSCYEFIPPINDQFGTFIPVESHLCEILSPDLLNQQLQYIDTALATGEIQVWEHEIVKYGKLGNVEVRLVPCGSEECLVIVRDISDRKQLELALQDSETKLNDILNSATASISRLLVKADGTWEIDFISAGCEVISGYTPAELNADQSIWLSRMNSEDWQAVEAEVYADIFAERKGIYTYRFQHKDGSWRWFSQKNSSRWDASQNAWSVTVISTDISELKYAESILRPYERIISATSDCVALIDVNYNYQLINETYLEWHSKSYEEIIGHSVSELLGAENFETIAKPRFDRCLEGEAQHFEGWIDYPKAGLLYVDATYSPYLDENGTITGIVINVRNISDRQQAKLALERKTEELDSFFSVSLDLFAIANTEGYFVQLNSQWEKTLGYSLEELKSVKSIEFVHPDDIESTLQVREGLKQQIPLPSFINRYRHLNGSYRWIEWSCFPIGDLIYATARDISDRKRFEQELQLSEARLQAFLNNSPAIIFMKDLEGRYLSVNQEFERILRTTQAEVLGKTDLDFLPPEIANILRNNDRQTVSEGKAINFEETVEMHDGVHTYFATKFPIIDINGNPYATGGISLDISDRKQVEIELSNAKDTAEAATMAKSEFLANMSHEIRTPMNGVLGIARLLSDTNLTEEQQNFVQIIQQSGDALLAIINDILDFSKIESGMLVLERQEMDIEDILSSICKLLNSQAIEKQIHLDYEISVDTPIAMIGDSSRLRQILLNLIGNALKFTPSGSVAITVSSKSVGDRNINQHELTFTVKDSGIGISSDRLGLLFRAFSQADTSFSRKYGGTGLGLAISKRLAELMGGTIWVESLGNVGGNPPSNWFPTSPTQGSTFYFTIVLSAGAIAASSQKQPIPTTLDPQMAAQFPLRILLAEDNLVNQKVAIFTLKKLGYKVDVANNGLEALNAVRQQTYDLVLMDVQMPEMDGLTATRLIRQLTGSQPRIVAMTANALPEDRQTCLDAGMDDYLSKPFNIQALIQVFSNCDRTI